MNDREHLAPTIAAYERDALAYADKPDDRAWLIPLVERFASLLEAGALVLDLGCASGRETVELRAAGLRVLGLDMTAAFLRIAIERHPAEGYVRGDFLHLPLVGGSLDGVWASASLLHLTPGEVDGALAEVRRVLRHGGVFYSSMQIGHSAGMVPSTQHESVSGPRYYTFWQPQDWCSRLEAAGFEVIALDAADLGQAAEFHCNQGGSGWLTALVRGET
ncbi:MAG: class I SAM-dependent methyltransferase [Dehalococcoidia bacterium]